MVLTIQAREAAARDDPTIEALGRFITDAGEILGMELGEETKSVVRQILRLATDERGRLADRLMKAAEGPAPSGLATGSVSAPLTAILSADVADDAQVVRRR